MGDVVLYAYCVSRIGSRKSWESIKLFDFCSPLSDMCMCVCVCVCVCVCIYIYIYIYIYLFSLQSFIPVLKLFCKMLYTFPVNKWFSDEVHLTIKVIEYWNPVLTYLTLNCKEYYVVLPNIVMWLECVPCVHHSRLLRWIYRKTDFW